MFHFSALSSSPQVSSNQQQQLLVYRMSATDGQKITFLNLIFGSLAGEQYLVTLIPRLQTYHYYAIVVTFDTLRTFV